MSAARTASGSSSRAHLRRLLAERNQYPDRAPQIDAEIRKTFERKVAILALDMSGFSRLTERYGIIHYLAMIEQMEGSASLVVRGNHGQVIKQEADNLYAVFDHPVNALEAALDIFRAFEAMNTVLPDHRDIHGSIGIGYGATLVVGDEELYGAEMNLSSKLGEDIAERKQILLTKAAYEALPAGRYACTPVNTTLAGMEIEYYRLEPSTAPKLP